MEPRGISALSRLAQFGLKATEELFEIYDEIDGNLWRSLEKGEVRQEELKRERFRLPFKG